MKKMNLMIMTFITLSGCLFGQQEPSANLQRLLEGNKRFVNDKLTHCSGSQIRREELSNFQEPFAAIVACSDSRVSPELVFDQGIGDLFVVRTAGNVVGPVEQDSIDFAVFVLHAKLILVVGHEGCGAVRAVMNGEAKGVPNVASLIEPALVKFKGTENLAEAIKANVKNVVADLKANQHFAQALKEGKLEIRGAYYDFHSGNVTIID